MHVAINGYFIGQEETGSGQYLKRLLEELPTVWEGKITLISPAEVRMPLKGPLGKVWFEQIGVPRLAAKAGADLLHVPYFGAPVVSPLPVVVTIHDLLQLTVPRLRGGPRNRLYSAVAAIGARRAVVALADSEFSRQAAMTRLGLAGERVLRCHLAADPRFAPQPDPGERDLLRNRLGLEEPFILYAGGLDWRKNVPILIRAYARAKLPMPLVIAGEARSRRLASFPDLRGAASDAGVADRVRFLGWVDEELKPALYRAAHVFAFPSLYEGFGLTPLEAMACGTVTVCSNATSLPEVAGDAALLFDPEDEGALTSALVRAVSDKDLRAQLRKAGPEQAAGFSWQSTARTTVTAYEMAVGKRGR